MTLLEYLQSRGLTLLNPADNGITYAAIEHPGYDIVARMIGAVGDPAWEPLRVCHDCGISQVEEVIEVADILLGHFGLSPTVLPPVSPREVAEPKQDNHYGGEHAKEQVMPRDGSRGADEKSRCVHDE